MQMKLHPEKKARSAAGEQVQEPEGLRAAGYGWLQLAMAGYGWLQLAMAGYIWRGPGLPLAAGRSLGVGAQEEDSAVSWAAGDPTSGAALPSLPGWGPG